MLTDSKTPFEHCSGNSIHFAVTILNQLVPSQTNGRLAGHPPRIALMPLIMGMSLRDVEKRKGHAFPRMARG